MPRRANVPLFHAIRQRCRHAADCKIYAALFDAAPRPPHARRPFANAAAARYCVCRSARKQRPRLQRSANDTPPLYGVAMRYVTPAIPQRRYRRCRAARAEALLAKTLPDARPRHAA